MQHNNQSKEEKCDYLNRKKKTVKNSAFHQGVLTASPRPWTAKVTGSLKNVMRAAQPWRERRTSFPERACQRSLLAVFQCP